MHPLSIVCADLTVILSVIEDLSQGRDATPPEGLDHRSTSQKGGQKAANISAVKGRLQADLTSTAHVGLHQSALLWCSGSRCLPSGPLKVTGGRKSRARKSAAGFQRWHATTAHLWGTLLALHCAVGTIPVNLSDA
jgi:hypothetical protein